MRRKFLVGLLATPLLVVFFCSYWYVHLVGYPQRVEARWVSPRVVQWYWTGMPGWPYPAEIQYGYRGAQGQFVAHGPYIRRIWTASYSGNLSHPSRGLEIEETGNYSDGQKNGVFTKYQTYWRRPESREYYQGGKLVREEFLDDSVPKWFLSRPSSVHKSK